MKKERVKVHFKSRWGIIIHNVYLPGKIKYGRFVGTSCSGNLYYKRPLVVEFQPYMCVGHEVKVHSYRLIDNKTGQCCKVDISPKIYHLGQGEAITVTLPLNKIGILIQENLKEVMEK